MPPSHWSQRRNYPSTAPPPAPLLPPVPQRRAESNWMTKVRGEQDRVTAHPFSCYLAASERAEGVSALQPDAHTSTARPAVRCCQNDATALPLPFPPAEGRGGNGIHECETEGVGSVGTAETGSGERDEGEQNPACKRAGKFLILRNLRDLFITLGRSEYGSESGEGPDGMRDGRAHVCPRLWVSPPSVLGNRRVFPRRLSSAATERCSIHDTCQAGLKQYGYFLRSGMGISWIRAAPGPWRA